MLRTRLAILNIVGLALVLSFLCIGIYSTAEISLARELDRSIEQRAATFTRVVPKFRPPGNRPPFPGLDMGREAGIDAREIEVIRRQLELVVPRIFDRNGIGVMDPTDVVWDPAGFERAKHGQTALTTVDQIRVLSVPVSLEGNPNCVAQFAASNLPMKAELARLRSTLLTFLPVSLLTAAFVGLFLTRRILHPFGELAAQARSIDPLEKGARLSAEGTDEFGLLAKAFNESLGRLERSRDQLEQFTANAAHELRSPLTVILARVGILGKSTSPPEVRERSLKAIEASAHDMTRLIDDLLLLSRSDQATLAAQFEAIDLQAMLEAVVDELPEPLRDRVKLELDAVPCISGSPPLLKRLFKNLLENGLRYSEDAVRVRAFALPDAVEISVCDLGIGVAPEDQLRVFDRFFRADAARTRDAKVGPGTGLGLPLAQSIAQVHGSQICLESQLGVGSTFKVSLTYAESQASNSM